MKNKTNGKYIKSGLTLFFSLCGCILFYYLIFYGQDLKNSISNFFSVFTSIITGVGMAYILNGLMKIIEKYVSKPLVTALTKKSKKKNKDYFNVIRGISVFFTIVIFGFILYGLIILIVPQVIESIESIIVRVPQYINNLNTWFTELLRNNPKLEEYAVVISENAEEWITSYLVPKLQELISNTSSSLLGSVVSVFNGVINFVIGIIVSIYLLYSKETYCAQAKKITYAIMREERANNLINNMRYGNKIFGGFISGKIIDSFLMAIICYICLLILRMPYAELVSVVIGVTNIIPYFGPFIGAIPSALLILMVSPMKCLTFIIFILILQQFDGSIMGPKILGGSTGLNGFWVIFSITLFSGFFGLLGMFVGVPLFAVIYAAFKTFVNERLAKKNMPTDTNFYISNDYHSINIEGSNSGQAIRFAKKTFDNVYPELEQTDNDSSDDEK